MLAQVVEVFLLIAFFFILYFYNFFFCNKVNNTYMSIYICMYRMPDEAAKSIILMKVK